ncbi:hypothetical protein [Pedobacter sp. R-06]|uniref:hypothetical protein n=1 Tax=Pedobacter sp. R-06 TaxID=3404051 RepID=UPI003CF9EE24
MLTKPMMVIAGQDSSCLACKKGWESTPALFFERLGSGPSSDARGELFTTDNDEPLRFQIIGFHFEGGEGFAVADMQKQATATLNPAPRCTRCNADHRG